MPPTVINVEGKSTLSRLAERAKIDVLISSSDYEQAKASENVVGTASNLQADLDKLCHRLANGDIAPDAPVSFYSIASLSTSNDDEYDEDHNKTGKRIYTATTSVDIRFRDFARLGELVVSLSTTPFLSLQGIQWKLTDESNSALEQEARIEALRDAIKRARDYAQVIDRGTLTPVKIDDSGHAYSYGRVKQTARKATSSAMFGIGVGLDFEPQMVEVNATLAVEFHAE